MAGHIPEWIGTLLQSVGVNIRDVFGERASKPDLAEIECRNMGAKLAPLVRPSHEILGGAGLYYSCY